MSAPDSSAKASADALFTASLAQADPEIAEVVRRELGRQRDEIELIASENIVSRAVLEAQGSVLTNKYAEGLPGKRYYGGCQYVDVAETLAIERVKKLFGCGFANVQPHSGASANAAAFMALMQPGDTFLGLNLAAGGHLTHGSPVNMSGKWFKPVPYGVRRDDHRIDMDEVAKLAREHKPKAISGEHRLWLLQRIKDGDFTLRGLVAELAERGLKVDYRSVWEFVHAEKLSFKKKPGGWRTRSSRRRAAAGAVDKVSRSHRA